MHDEVLRLEAELRALRVRAWDLEQQLARAREVPRVQETYLGRITYYGGPLYVTVVGARSRSPWPRRIGVWRTPQGRGGNRTGLTTKHRDIGRGAVFAPNRGCRDFTLWDAPGTGRRSVPPSESHRGALLARANKGMR